MGLLGARRSSDASKRAVMTRGRRRRHNKLKLCKDKKRKDEGYLKIETESITFGHEQRKLQS